MKRVVSLVRKASVSLSKYRSDSLLFWTFSEIPASNSKGSVGMAKLLMANSYVWLLSDTSILPFSREDNGAGTLTNAKVPTKLLSLR